MGFGNVLLTLGGGYAGSGSELFGSGAPEGERPTAYNQTTPGWLDEQSRQAIGAMGEYEVGMARDVYDRRMRGEDSVALAARMQQLGDVRRRAAMAGAMGPLAARQGMFRGGDEAIGRLTSTAGAHQSEIEQARAAAAGAYARRSDYELALQRLKGQRMLGGEKAWQQHEARREALDQANKARVQNWIMSMGSSASTAAGAAAGGE